MRRSPGRPANYTPYKAPPPRARFVKGGTKSRRRFDKPLRKKTETVHMNTKKFKTTRKRRKKSQRVMETIGMIDYGDAYRTPDSYYVRDSVRGKVYTCPKPKQNLMHINEDPTLGGVGWKRPSPKGTCSTFNKACSRTPVSSYYTRIIPWDHKKRDFAYGAVQDACFKGFYDRRALKSKIDLHRARSSWDPVTSYNWCWLISVILMILLFITWLVLVIVYWNHWKTNWVWWFLWLGLGLGIVILFCCVFRVGSNSRAKKRFQRIDEACSEINANHLYGTGTAVYPGESAAWLEIEMDPRRTEIAGPVRHDKLSYLTESKPLLSKKRIKTTTNKTKKRRRSRSPRRRKVVEETTVIRSPSRKVSEISRAGRVTDDSLYASNPPSQVQESTYQRMEVGDSVYRSNYSRSPSPMSNSAVSDKKLSFYDRLKKSKAQKNSQASFSRVYSPDMSPTPVSGGINPGSTNTQFTSMAPRPIAEPTGAPINLMAPSPRR